MPNFNPEFLAAMLFSVGAVLWIINQARQFMGKNAPPQPFEVREALEYCPLVVHQQAKAEIQKTMDHLHCKLDQVDGERRSSVSKVYDFTRTELTSLRMETKADMDSLRKELHEGLAGVHERVNAVLTAVSKLEGNR